MLTNRERQGYYGLICGGCGRPVGLRLEVAKFACIEPERGIQREFQGFIDVCFFYVSSIAASRSQIKFSPR